MKSLITVFITAIFVACGASSDARVTTQPETPGVCVSGPSVSPAVITLHIGDTLRVTAAACRVDPATWHWRMSDTLVASVDSLTGLVRGRGKGTATVIAWYPAEPTELAAGIVTVTP